MIFCIKNLFFLFYIKEFWIFVLGLYIDDWDFGSWEDGIIILIKLIIENSFLEVL